MSQVPSTPITVSADPQSTRPSESASASQAARLIKSFRHQDEWRITEPCMACVPKGYHPVLIPKSQVVDILSRHSASCACRDDSCCPGIIHELEKCMVQYARIANTLSRPGVGLDEDGDYEFIVFGTYLEHQTDTQSLSSTHGEQAPVPPYSAHISYHLAPTTTADTALAFRPATQTTRATSIKNKHMARPMNAFMLYRQSLHHKIQMEHPGIHNADISRIIAEQWRNESQDVIERFRALAREEKEKFMATHVAKYGCLPQDMTRYINSKWGRRSAGNGAKKAMGVPATTPAEPTTTTAATEDEGLHLPSIYELLK
ncbi:hypothetical protein EV182_002007 [Spiromyces aspiralis]|uniref:Uncharacterized protein n=1 Tax=Spiromyces aspiralis TaxID=68401 RepID=A0ACC1HEP3_9FUNG|nr:hypothetical protein EV182_002007 [Spiromyces aspiralis]